MERKRWIGVGRSDHPHAARAGAAAAACALEGRDAALVVVFSADTYDLHALVQGVRVEAGEVPLVGCSTAGEIATGGPGDSGVVVLALGGEGFSIATAVAPEASRDLRAAGAAAAGAFDRVDERPHRALLLLADALAGDQQDVVRGAYGVLGAATPLVGGCAGDGLKMARTFQLHGDHVLDDAVVGAAIASDAPLGIGVRHGWKRVGEPMVVTESHANRVYRLDDRPALEVYLERLAAPVAMCDDPAAFTAFALTHPLGLARRNGEEQVRFVGEADLDDRSLGCVAEVPQGALVWLMEGDEGSVLDAADAACAAALEPLGGRVPRGLLVFGGVARRGVLGNEGIVREVRRVAGHAGGAPIAGFYGYGEIARTRGAAGFHNQALVVLAVA